MPSQYTRPNIPYNPPEVLPNSNRYELTANQNQPINSDQLDGDVNYLIASLNALYAFASGIPTAPIPGATNPGNAGKFMITDGLTPATISWTKVTENYYAALSIPRSALQLGCVDDTILALGAVTNTKIRDGAIKDNNIDDDELSFNKIKILNNAHFQQFFNTQNDGTLNLSKIIINNGEISGLKITTNTLPAAAIVNDSLTRAQISPVMKPLIGQVVDWAGASGTAVPSGWLKCIGQSVSKTTYADLFAIIGTVWGDSTATNFTIPDLRGRTTFGIDGTNTGGRIVSGTVAIAENGGKEKHTLTIPETPIHHHTYNSFTKTGLGVEGGNYPSSAITSQSSSVGGGLPHNNMPPYMLIQKLIYTGVV